MLYFINFILYSYVVFAFVVLVATIIIKSLVNARRRQFLKSDIIM